jgi:hypothetical protein
MRKWRTHSRNEHQTGLDATQRAVNKMIRERDAGLPCITCGHLNKLEAGHFRISNHGTTRYHPWNLNGQCAQCNRFSGGLTYEHAKAIDAKYGAGTADFLHKLSMKIEPWDTRELDQLRSAARMGPRAYEQLYFELRPQHWCKAI